MAKLKIMTQKTKPKKKRKTFVEKLKEAIETRKLSKAHIARSIKNSRPTFYARLEDGKFTQWEKETIKKTYGI